MKKIVFSNKAVKELEKVKQNPKFNPEQFKTVIEKIVNGEPLDPKYRDHKLAKNTDKKYSGLRDVHVSNDVVMLYRIDDDTLYISNIGTHSYLGLNEEIEENLT